MSEVTSKPGVRQRFTFRVLGPVRVRAGAGDMPGGPPRQGAVLAVLAVDAGRVVAVDALVHRVWGITPPEHVRRTLHTYVARIRRLLEQAGTSDDDHVPLLNRSGGYILDVAPEEIDWHRFRRLVELAGDAGCSEEQRAVLLQEGLELWQGEPLTGVAGDWAARMRHAWGQQRLDAAVAWARAQLHIGKPSAVIGPVSELLSHYPLAEPLTAVLMRALCAVGGDSDALTCYRSLRQRLVEELGADPGSDLQELHQAILRGELHQPSSVRVWTPARDVPAQLPSDLPAFTGRVGALAWLDAILASADRQPAAVVIFAVSGMAGVGKTALAVHWAHQVRDRFADGQLYVNLRGFDPNSAPIEPARALRSFLEALGVPLRRIPADLDAQAALYRSLLSHRRMLVLLDNARDAEQIRPLLPGTPGCLVLVTSRHQLPGLVATHNARPLTLGPLSLAESRELLARRFGVERAAAEPSAVDEIITCCARLPLALATAAARAAADPRLPLQTLAEELRDASHRLDVLGGRYTATRQRLVDELGAEPGEELRNLHKAILRGDLDRPPPTPSPMRSTAPPPPAPVVPAQLPADVQAFAGRGAELAQLDSVLATAGRQPTTVAISALVGTPGVGKTALAVRWARQVADRFPDGQLYVNLRGFHPGSSAVSPAEAIRGFLDAFGVPPQHIPVGLEVQAALYRSLLADRRVLVVLDNARDSDQVRPLLPGAPGSVVVVTSRDQLTGLVTAEAAHVLVLDLLTVAEARQMLARRLGDGRVAAEPEAVDTIIELCARLPLALAIVAGRAAAHPRFPLNALATELRNARSGLDAFAGRDPSTDLRAVFSWSHRTLDPAALRLFRLLGLHPAPDIAAPAAASLAGLPRGRVRVLLAELAQANLISEPAPGRFTFHDLLRTHAIELADSVDSEAERRVAIARMLDHYLHTAHTADRLLHPHRDSITLAPVRHGVSPEVLADREQALAWLTAEHRILLATVDRAAHAGFDTHAWQLAFTLELFFDRRAHWHDQAVTQRTGLDAAQRLGDRAGQAHTHRGLAHAYARLGRNEMANPHLRQALDLNRQLGDHTNEAHTHLSLGWVLAREGRHDEVLDHAQRALSLYRAAGHRDGQARALNTIGWSLALLGDHQQALAHCEQAIALHQEIADHNGEAHTWDSLGQAHHHLGQHDQAAACYQHAIDLFRALGDRYEEADTLTRLADTYHAASRPDSAHDTWQRALTMLEEIRHHGADQVRAKLDTP